MGLFLSDIFGGPELLDKPIDKTTSIICQRMQAYKDQLIKLEDGTLNVVFHFPGSVSQPEFAGVRAGSFSKAKRLLVVQVAFPIDLLASDRFAHHYLEFLKTALSEGKRYLATKGIPFSLEDHIMLAEKSIEGMI